MTGARSHQGIPPMSPYATPSRLPACVTPAPAEPTPATERGEEWIEVVARSISPEWFDHEGDRHVLNNFPGQHLQMQKTARDLATRLYQSHPALRPSPPAPEAEGAQPFAYAYVYPWHDGTEVIRLGTNGRAINGSKPIRSIPLYARPSAPSVEEVKGVLEPFPPSFGMLERTGCYWVVAKGRTRPDEPLYGAQIMNGMTSEIEAQAEAGTLAEAIEDALAMHPIGAKYLGDPRPFNPYDITGAIMSDPECFKELDGEMQERLCRAIAENCGFTVTRIGASHGG